MNRLNNKLFLMDKFNVVHPEMQPQGQTLTSSAERSKFILRLHCSVDPLVWDVRVVLLMRAYLQRLRWEKYMKGEYCVSDSMRKEILNY